MTPDLLFILPVVFVFVFLMERRLRLWRRLVLTFGAVVAYAVLHVALFALAPQSGEM